MAEELNNMSAEELKNMIQGSDISFQDLANDPDLVKEGAEMAGVDAGKAQEVVEESNDIDEAVEKMQEPEQEEDQFPEDTESDETYSFTVDVESLPSQGVVYDFDEIPAKTFDLSEMKHLDLVDSGGNVLQFHESIFNALQGATGIDLGQLTYGDEIPLFINIRANTWAHGHKYYLPEFNCQDPTCGEKNVRYQYDLTNLEYNTLDESYEDPKVYEVKGREIQLRILREKHVFKIERFIYNNHDKRKFAGMTPQQMYKQCLKACSIKSVQGMDLEGVEDRLLLIEENKLSHTEFDVLRAFEQKYSHDVDMNITVECMHCGTEQPHKLPFSREFFYPDSKEDLEQYEK